MPQVYLFATLTETGAVMIPVRYLHATRETKEEADVLCKDLNKMLINAKYAVVEDE